MLALKIGQFVTIILFALVVGVFWGTWFALSRSITSITSETFLEVGKAIIRNLVRPMRALLPGAIASALLTVRFVPERPSAAFAWTLLVALLMVAALVITLAVNVPIDNQIRGWTVTSLPTNWKDIRDRWETYHAPRTFVSIAALATIVIGTLMTK